MQYRTLGNSGLLVSAVGLGCNNFGTRIDADKTRAVVDAAVESGVTLFDTADIYGRGDSETFLGEALKGRRDRVVLATKFGYQPVDMGYGAAAGAKASRSYIRRAVEESLRRLQTDYIDLYQLHDWDPLTPIDETLAALSELVREGKVRYIGNSNFTGWQIAQAAHVARETGAVPFISAQNEWSLLDRRAEQEVVPAAINYGLGVLPWYPLANGLLTGKVRRATGIPEGSRLASRPERVTEAALDTVERLAAWGEAHGRSVLEIGVGAFAAQPGCSSVIAGATAPEQVRANAAAGEWVPSPAELAEIDEALKPAAGA